MSHWRPSHLGRMWTLQILQQTGHVSSQTVSILNVFVQLNHSHILDVLISVYIHIKHDQVI